MDFGCWIFASLGFWILNPGFWILDFVDLGFGILIPSSRITGFVNVPVMPRSIGKIVRSWIWDFHIFCGSKTSFLGAVSFFFWKDFGEVWSLKLGI